MTIIDKYSDKVKGILNTFDRMIIKGHLRQFFSTSGKMYFLSEEDVLLKDFGAYAEKITAKIKDNAVQMAKDASRPYIYLNSSKTSKEKTALEALENSPVDEGLICVIATVETCTSLDIYKNKETFKLELRNRQRKCLYLYFYYLDKEFGFMHVKLQTWFPFEIQVYINGREHLSKQLDKAGIGYKRYDNCFTHIDDIEKAQEIANKIESKKFSTTFDVFAQRVNPMIERITEIFGNGYFWCVDQCEYASDVMFNSRADLEKVYPDLVEHALISFNCEDVMTFLGRKLHHSFAGEVVSDIKKRQQGVRIKHRMKSNSIKMYDKDSVLRIETTINDPHEFKIYKEVRRKGVETMEWVNMGKSIANLYRYAQVSLSANTRYLSALTAAEDTGEAVAEIEKVCERITKNNRDYAGLNILSKEVTDIFAAILDGKNHINGFTNKSIRPAIFKDSDDKKTRNKVTRILAKLRAHSIISKIPRTFSYRVSEKGIRIIYATLKMKKREVRKFNKSA